MPRFSVIIPAYNASAYIGDCLDSLTSQTCGDLEIIAVNDGSTDGTGEILRDRAARDSRIIIIDKSNGGVSSARNAALAKACGEWIVFCDADDMYEPDALAAMSRIIDNDGIIDIVCCSSIQFGAGIASSPYVALSDTVTDSPRIIDGIKHYALWAQALRRSIIEAFGIRFAEELKHAEDRVFLYGFAAHARRLATSSQVVYRYRRSETQATNNRDGLAVAGHELRAAALIKEMADRYAAAKSVGGEVTSMIAAALQRRSDDTVRVAMFHFFDRKVTVGSLRRFLELYRSAQVNRMSSSRLFAVSLNLYVRRRIRHILNRCKTL